MIPAHKGGRGRQISLSSKTARTIQRKPVSKKKKKRLFNYTGVCACIDIDTHTYIIYNTNIQTDLRLYTAEYTIIPTFQE